MELTTLYERAGFAVGVAAVRLLGSVAGRRVVVVVGRGSNGADGTVAARVLRRLGASVSVRSASPDLELPASCDLVVDAAYGTGFHGSYRAPEVPRGCMVLAVDVPSGLDADTGVACPGAVVADATVTFVAMKPGLLLADGPAHAGRVTVHPIGLEPPACQMHRVSDEDLSLVPPRSRSAQKWETAVYVVAGSPGMEGAPSFVTSGALRAGAGMVRCAVPGDESLSVVPAAMPPEVVRRPTRLDGFDTAVLDDLAASRSVVLGPGLGSAPAIRDGVRRLLGALGVPVVLDADGINALGDLESAALHLSARRAPTVLTPHEGEFRRLTGVPVGPDRCGAVRAVASMARSVVLLKGPTTVVADPKGRVLLVDAGTPALASAGTGDVLSGVIGAFLARGLGAFEAAALAAHVHGRASALSPQAGLVASELPSRIASVLGRSSRR